MLSMCACVACWLKRGIPFSRSVRKIKTLPIAVTGFNALDRHLAGPEMF